MIPLFQSLHSTLTHGRYCLDTGELMNVHSLDAPEPDWELVKDSLKARCAQHSARYIVYFSCLCLD